MIFLLRIFLTLASIALFPVVAIFRLARPAVIDVFTGNVFKVYYKQVLLGIWR